MEPTTNRINTTAKGIPFASFYLTFADFFFDGISPEFAPYTVPNTPSVFLIGHRRTDTSARIVDSVIDFHYRPPFQYVKCRLQDIDKQRNKNSVPRARAKGSEASSRGAAAGRVLRTKTRGPPRHFHGLSRDPSADS
jgi:hypothetical protein